MSYHLTFVVRAEALLTQRFGLLFLAESAQNT